MRNAEVEILLSFETDGDQSFFDPFFRPWVQMSEVYKVRDP